jgi:Domain of unknown function (DUF2760)
MRAITLLVAVVLAVVTGLILAIRLGYVPGVLPFEANMLMAAPALALLLAVLVAAGGGHPAAETAVTADVALPAPPPAAGHPAEAEVVSFLALLQEKGRLVDFLMEDITAFGDSQVSAAARVVHQGCRAVLDEHLKVRPVRDEAEGTTVTVEPGYAADAYRFTGKISGEPPFTGRLVHRGWRTEQVRLPRIVALKDDRLPTLAPAEVELS